ncbi:aminopeptidase P N-terminal domain-containing protein [Thiomonas sp.]|uniref:aminopeptidase P N-terminal domain-containing protein n=1 Tax=Thiomonas sp. TaxID=2047785 RepID=UPI002638E848|nr:aminopeptidase P N-terminal domain-containing protein [Thiomonas sp.]
MPPTLPDAALLARCKARRDQLARHMAAAGGGVALLPTAPEVLRNRDVDYPYRHDSYFYYLTAFTEPQALLALQANAAGQSRSVLFCRDKNAEREIWDGYRWGPEAAREAFGFDAALSIDSLDAELPKLLADQPAVWWPFAVHKGFETRVEGWLAAVRAQARNAVTAPHTQHDVCALLDDMRLFKDDDELGVIRRACAISAQAHVRAMQACARSVRQPPPQGLREYHLEAELLYTFRQHGAQSPAYGSIVAAGANACVLHYRAGDAAVRADDLVLIDAACELDGYASDITRTFPAGGRFSGAQRDLYAVVLAAQAAALDACRDGARFTDPHDAALRVLAQGMLDFGLVPRDTAADVDAVLATGAYKRFYMHRTSHWMGMDVHDCGDYAEPGQAIDILPDGSRKRPARILRPGMVLTIEPGLYVRAADDVPAAFHGIGIRIEDDVAIRAAGQPCEVLTADAPKTIEAIEELMRG